MWRVKKKKSKVRNEDKKDKDESREHRQSGANHRAEVNVPWRTSDPHRETREGS